MKVSKKNLFLLILGCALFSCSQKKLVSTTITFMQPYCGGARPTPEIQADALKAKPYSNRTIVAVSSKGRVDSAKTNADGTFKINLKPGTYKLFEAWRYYKKATAGLAVSDFDKECIKAEWKKEIKEVIVSKMEVKINDKNEIIEVCPWNLPCILESHKPPAHE
ncbi:MAG: carboxypeptidase regulatory-like domain-containing protein [Bacteroidia bacterium]|nr:carboxypeptidase regulatory-like domain-containing protein [Bacteroidia bacterium]